MLRRWWRSLNDIDQAAVVMALCALAPLMLGLALTVKLVSGRF